MCNVQRMLLLPGGANGGWSQQAQERLEKLLAKPLVSKPSKPLPIEDAAPLLAIEDEKQDADDSSSVAIEDEKQDADDSSSDSSSDSDSGSDVAMKTEEVEKAMKYKDDQIAKAKEDFESIFNALHACQGELEEANKKIQTQEVEIAGLKRLLEECRAAAPSDDEDSDAEMGSDSDWARWKCMSAVSSFKSVSHVCAKGKNERSALRALWCPVVSDIQLKHVCMPMVSPYNPVCESNSMFSLDIPLCVMTQVFLLPHTSDLPHICHGCC